MEKFLLAEQFIESGLLAAVSLFLVVGLSRIYPLLHGFWIQALGLLAVFIIMFLPHGYVFLFGSQKYAWITRFGIEVTVPHSFLLVMDIAGAVAGFVVGAVVYLFLLARSKLIY
ncbi:hypothetical protein [Pseudomonas palleroniana]|uniref:hypothetical protein n=1 Tax=Pseudomonas palleroniana TaxID=191390 RepID=UPI0018E66E80|nr:hypothetical protein [Pseudomonas palleroniana]MBI6911668.1 hypothetical protein [Pseudomonas palleroniana]